MVFSQKARAAGATDFNPLSHEQKQTIVTAIIRGAAEQAGQYQHAAFFNGDNDIYDMEQIADWIDQLTNCHCALCATKREKGRG